MRGAISRLMTAASLAGATGLLVLGHPAEVRAQTVFCPTTFNAGNGTVTLANGSCTDRSNGAFSGAALASQALSELSEMTTQETTKNMVKSIAERREQEKERCPEGFSRVGGTCQRNPPPVAEAAPAVSPGPREEHVVTKAKKPKAAAIRRERAPEAAPKIVRRSPPPPPAVLPVPIEPAVRFATWTQVYGDYEKRDAAGPGILNCCIINNIPLQWGSRAES